MLRNINRIIHKPYLLKYYFVRIFYRYVSDKFYIETLYQANFGKKPNLVNPMSYNEKLQWLKLNDIHPEYSKLVDKSSVKAIVLDKVGSLGIKVIPTLNIYSDVNEIDFDDLPDRFVLKCTHDSGSVVICKNRDTFDYKKAISKINRSLHRNFFYKSREYPYKYIKPRIVAEPFFFELGEGSLLDYKLFCFNGICKYLFIASDRDTCVKFDYFDSDFNRLNIRQNVHPTSDRVFEKPKNFDTMKKAAEILSEGIPQVRVDFYIVDDIIYFGEMTFFHHGGFVPFIPNEADIVWGNEIVLPKKTGC